MELYAIVAGTGTAQVKAMGIVIAMKVMLGKHAVKFCVLKIAIIKVNVHPEQVAKVYIANVRKAGKAYPAMYPNAQINATGMATVYMALAIVMVISQARNAM
jgi:hypothetical protein